MAHKQIIPVSIIAGLSLSFLASTLYLPAMPMMATYFGVSDSVIQHSLSMFQIGLVLSIIIAGPVSDAYGRRPVLLMGLLLFLIASIMLIVPFDIDAFLALRLVQGLGAGFIFGLGQAIVRDAFHERESVRIFSQMFAYILLTPAVAPVLGGYLTTAFGWRSCFVFIAWLVFIALIATYRYFPETHPPSLRNKLRIETLAKTFRRLLSRKGFVLFDLVNILPFSGIWFYRAVMPFVYIKYMGVSIHAFGYYVFVQALLQSLTSYGLQKIVDRVGIFRLMGVGIVLMAVSSALVIATAYMTPHDPLLAAIAVMPFMMGILLTTPTSSAKTMSYGEHSRGVASSVLAGSRQLFIAGGALLAALTTHDTFKTSGIFMLGVSVLAGVFLYFARKLETT